MPFRFAGALPIKAFEGRPSPLLLKKTEPIVVDTERTAKQWIREVRTKLINLNAKILGVELNRVDTRRLRSILKPLPEPQYQGYD